MKLIFTVFFLAVAALLHAETEDTMYVHMSNGATLKIALEDVDSTTFERSVVDGENNQPVAEFSTSPSQPRANLDTVFFTDLSSSAPTSWYWSFGDGTYTADQNPSKVYTTAGDYPVVLWVSNAHGEDRDTMIVSVQVVSITPIADFNAQVQAAVQDGQYCSFTDLSANLPSSWQWSFGDDSTSTEQNPVHYYTANGTYTVTLTATNLAGSSDTSKTVTIQLLEDGGGGDVPPDGGDPGGDLPPGF